MRFSNKQICEETENTFKKKKTYIHTKNGLFSPGVHTHDSRLVSSGNELMTV